MSRFDLSQSRALWNRTGLALESDEVLAQLLDRGEVAAWRELYRLASGPGEEAAVPDSGQTKLWAEAACPIKAAAENMIAKARVRPARI